jgi:hypothetical protein
MNEQRSFTFSTDVMCGIILLIIVIGSVFVGFQSKRITAQDKDIAILIERVGFLEEHDDAMMKLKQKLFEQLLRNQYKEISNAEK